MTSAVPGSGDGHGSTESDASTTPKNDTDDRSNPTTAEAEAVKAYRAVRGFWSSEIAKWNADIAKIVDAADTLASALDQKALILSAVADQRDAEKARADKAEEQHAVLQARCYEGFPSASDGIFDALKQAEQERARLLRDQSNAKAREVYYDAIVDALVKADVFDVYKAPEQYAPMLREWLKEQAEVSAERDRLAERLGRANRILRLWLDRFTKHDDPDGISFPSNLANMDACLEAWRKTSAHLAAGTPTGGGDHG